MIAHPSFLYRVDRREIGYLKFIFESYENLAQITTLDPEAGIVQIRVARGCEEDAGRILEELRTGFLLEEYRG